MHAQPVFLKHRVWFGSGIAGVLALSCSLASGGESSGGASATNADEPPAAAAGDFNGASDKVSHPSADGSAPDSDAGREGAASQLIADAGDAASLAHIDLEDLMAIDVTSVAGVETPWFDTPSAMYVLDAEDIRRTGHQSLPEALRLVPGLHVGRINSNTWAISSRGFGGRYANKLQVLIDGREVYDPFFSGVHWELQHVVLEDLDRIEVVRGPGATLWGANAVDGVINVTTRDASQTQGLYLSGVTGTHNHAISTGRYGGQLGEDTYFRVWASHRDINNFEQSDGEDFHDKWRMTHGGARVDHFGPDDFQLTVQGNVYGSSRIDEHIIQADPAGPPMTRTIEDIDTRATGGYLLGRVSQDLDPGHGWQFQAYYDALDRNALDGARGERHTADLDFRHHFRLADRHEIIWGANYRYNHTYVHEHDRLRFDPSRRDLQLVSGFAQATVHLVPDRLWTMFGSKIEYNNTTGFEYQPSARVAWAPTDRQTVWASVSRAVRRPSITDTDLDFVQDFITPNQPIVIRSAEDMRSETLMAYEAGYRLKLTDELTLDTAAFFNRYRHLIDLDEQTMRLTNMEADQAYGLETAVDWRVTDRWRLNASYTFHPTLDFDPRHRAHLRSHVDITDNLEFNAAAYFADYIRQREIGSYTRLDLGMTWRPRENIELAVWGQNLINPRHVEYDEPFHQPGQAAVPRSFYVQATIRY